MLIEFSNVSKRYPEGHEALRDVSFVIDKGEMVFLTGHSGAGKSTLLRLITLIEHATHGQVIVNGQNLGRLKRRTIPYFRRQIGMVFQDHKLLHNLSVFDNVALPLIVSGFHPRDLRRRVHAALDKVGLLNRDRAKPITLSGGEQQRVGIARAVVNRPSLLVADEPTGNLDAGLSDEIFDLFHDFNYHGVTVLVATHDLRHIKRLGKRSLTLADGRMTQQPEFAQP
jgi:cell division transport system ATP-binding protein